MAPTPRCSIRRVAEGVVDRGSGLEVEELDGRQPLIIGAFVPMGMLAAEVALEQGADAAAVGHQQGVGDARGARTLQQAQHDVDALGDLQVAGVRHHAPDVARGDRIGDDAEGGGTASCATGRADVPPR
jgi:hypothetical protein